MNDKIFFGVDIGGTKISTSVGRQAEGTIKVIDKIVFPTVHKDPASNIVKIVENLLEMRMKYGAPLSIGISCGGPLDVDNGIILSPPNLPGWNQVPIVKILKDQLNVQVYIENDANACALAEYHYGAGIGTSNMIFLTFGTGMGAGIVLGGKLYHGSTGGAGEVGHIRLAEDGPLGHGKKGSFEGFCSGAGLSRLGRMIIDRYIEQNKASEWVLKKASEPVTAEEIVTAAMKKDPAALEIMEICAAYLGRGLAVIVDILNPDMIVIGSIFERSGGLLIPTMEKVLHEEALESNLKGCRIVPAKLSDYLGDYAALSIAIERAIKEKLVEGDELYA